MPFENGYRGVAGGSVQDSYTDQPGIGVPGMAAFASDNILADSMVIGEADGIAAGLGIVFADLAGDEIGGSMPAVSANLPGAGTVADDFEGILLFDEAMQSDENGVAGWAQKRNGRVARKGRAGSRAYVRTKAVTDHTADGVHLVIVANATFDEGDFAPAAQGVIVQAGATTPNANNTGDGVVGAAVVDGATLGVHTLVCIGAAANLGTFEVRGPDGIFIGILTVGAEFVGGGITVTLADGAADFIVGDSFEIEVTATGAESVDISAVAKWRSSGAVGGVAIIELV